MSWWSFQGQYPTEGQLDSFFVGKAEGIDELGQFAGTYSKLHVVICEFS
jgi:hypothetical protein